MNLILLLEKNNIYMIYKYKIIYSNLNKSKMLKGGDL